MPKEVALFFFIRLPQVGEAVYMLYAIYFRILAPFSLRDLHSLHIYIELFAVVSLNL